MLARVDASEVVYGELQSGGFGKSWKRALLTALIANDDYRLVLEGGDMRFYRQCSAPLDDTIVAHWSGQQNSLTLDADGIMVSWNTKDGVVRSLSSCRGRSLEPVDALLHPRGTESPHWWPMKTENVRIEFAGLGGRTEAARRLA